MKPYLFICFFLVAFHVKSQDQKSGVAFGEIGFGYTNNLENPYYIFTEDIFSPDFFTHGITSEMHFGIMLNTKLNVGLASRYNTSLFFMDEQMAKDHLAKKFPGLALTWQTPGTYRFNNIHIGPVASLPIKRWSIDAELLFGYSSLRMPRLFAVASEKPYPNSEELYLYMYRPSQAVKSTTVTPSIGIRRYLGDVYWYIRPELFIGWTNDVIEYEYYPAKESGNEQLNSYETVFLNLMTGFGYRIE